MTPDNPFRLLIRAALKFRQSLRKAEVDEIEQTDFMQMALKLHEKFWLSVDKETEKADE